MNKETQELLSRIMSLAYEVSVTTENQVFAWFQPHRMRVIVKWYVHHFENSQSWNVVDGCNPSGEIYEHETELLKEAVMTLEGLLN